MCGDRRPKPAPVACDSAPPMLGYPASYTVARMPKAVRGGHNRDFVPAPCFTSKIDIALHSGFAMGGRATSVCRRGESVPALPTLPVLSEEELIDLFGDDP